MASKLPLRPSRHTLTPSTRPIPSISLIYQSHNYHSAAKDALRKAKAVEERAVEAAKRAQGMTGRMRIAKAIQIKLKSERRTAKRNIVAPQDAVVQEGALGLAAREEWIARRKEVNDRGRGKASKVVRKSDKPVEARVGEQRSSQPRINMERAKAVKELQELRRSVLAAADKSGREASLGRPTVLNIAKEPPDPWAARVDEALALAGNGRTSILKQKPPEEPRTIKRQSLEFLVAKKTGKQGTRAAQPDTKRNNSWKDPVRAGEVRKRPDARQMREDERAAKGLQAKHARRPQDSRAPTPYAKPDGSRGHFSSAGDGGRGPNAGTTHDDHRTARISRASDARRPGTTRAAKPYVQASKPWEELEGTKDASGLEKARGTSKQPWAYRGRKQSREREQIKALEWREFLEARKAGLGKTGLGNASF